MSREQFKKWPEAARFDDRIDFIRFAGVLSFAGGQKIHLASPRSTGSELSADAKQDQFGDISEVESNSPPVWTTVLADFVPDNISFVVESPRLHDNEPLR